ncbi:MAG: hypothetical protein IPM92_13710 [Saprospiraceae bacterium]|nr:hypothetical protein [Saprospiraceae bacterium]
MSNTWINHTVKIILYVLLQVLVLKEVNLGENNQNLIFIIVYPVVLLTLPLKIPQFFILLIAFIVGISVDMFYLSPGVHSGACLWMMVFRPLVLRLFEPKNGYPLDSEPTINEMGVLWFAQYAGVLLFAFFLSFFILQVFTFVYVGEILLKTLLSYFVSGIVIFLLQLFFSFRS